MAAGFIETFSLRKNIFRFTFFHVWIEARSTNELLIKVLFKGKYKFFVYVI